ncbi:MAG: hypothetical protein MUO72_00310 [Bacteroidales bacterium]|nr:hypothetical protein [Bacteroidales bacterium]
MGLYNLNPLRIKEQKLANKICPICQKDGIIPVLDEASRDSFDYVCNHCRPSFIISVSGSVLNSGYLEKLDENLSARNELQADIRQYNGKNYPLLIDTLSYFLRIEKELNYKSYTYADWLSGLLGSDLEVYKNIAPEELEKINLKKAEVFSGLVEKAYNELIINLESRLNKSINGDELIKSEISTVQMLLKGEISGIIGIVDLGNWELPFNDIVKIQKYYREAVNGKLNHNTIVSPNQRTLIGNAKKETGFKVKALAYEKYFKYLEGRLKKRATPYSRKQERFVLLKALYNLCDGSTANSCNLSKIAEILNWDNIKTRDIAHTLMDLGYVENLTKEGDIELTAYGLQTIEDLQDDEKAIDKFSYEEIKTIHSKIDIILDTLEKLDLGHEVIFEEIESLKDDAKKMSKKDFKSMAIGKIFSLGIDGLLDQNSVTDFLKNLFGSDFKYLK